MEKMKNMIEYFKKLGKEKSSEERSAIAQSVYDEIYNGDYKEEDKQRLCEIKYQYLTNELTQEEFDKYWEFESNQDKIMSSLAQTISSSENMENALQSLQGAIGENVQQRYGGFLLTNVEDTTPLTIVRDFKTKLYGRILEIDIPWLQGTGSVLSD